MYDRIKASLQIYLKMRESIFCSLQKNMLTAYFSPFTCKAGSVPEFVAILLLLVSGKAGVGFVSENQSRR